jgi:hypothetical protein
VFEEFKFAPGYGNFKGVTFGMAEDEETVGGEQAGEGWVIQEQLSEGGGTAVNVFFAVRRVGENEGEFRVRASKLGESGEDVLCSELEGFGREPGGEDVVSKDLGVPGGFFDTESGGSAAAKAFEAEGAGTSKEFKNVSANDASAETVEDSLFDEIGRGTDAEAFRNFQDAASGFATGDAHGGKVREVRKI